VTIETRMTGVPSPGYLAKHGRSSENLVSFRESE